MPVSKLPSLAVAECPVGTELLQVTVSPTATLMPLGENLKSLIVTPAEAAARAMTWCLGLSAGASSFRTGWAAAAVGAAAGAAGAGAAGGGGGGGGGGGAGGARGGGGGAPGGRRGA